MKKGNCDKVRFFALKTVALYAYKSIWCRDSEDRIFEMLLEMIAKEPEKFGTACFELMMDLVYVEVEIYYKVLYKMLGAAWEHIINSKTEDTKLRTACQNFLLLVHEKVFCQNI
ncbi:hypothetical protein MHBO_003131 [Bonamia ostreae]|uniref:Uncharacterized protein n=1 Tax=Bonamia ostreae TaxID=126728 RepID=A0ABV2APK2_9EUKA